VAKQCDHCGKILPSDTIRYCPGCGKLVASSRPAKRSLSEDPPAWMKQLETSLTSNRSKMPLRELNVKVWDEATKDLIFQQSGLDSDGNNLEVMDNLPTNPLMVASSSKISTPTSAHSNLSGEDVDEVEVAEELPTSPELTSVSQNIPVNRVTSSHGLDFGNGNMSHDQMEDIATRPYVAQPRNISREIAKPDQQQRQAMQPPTGFMNSPAIQSPVTPMPLPQSQYPPAQPSRQTPPVSMPVPPLVRPKKGKRTLFAIVIGLLFILLLGGVIAWVIVAQPFAVPEITNTTRNFKDTSLAVSLQYPQNWAVDENKQNGTVSFYDVNHTDQVNITVVVAGNQSIDQYLARTMSSVGISAQRTQTEVSFAGATWHQIQGSVQESGANYTATLLVTMHGEHYYSILQLAPSPTYPLEEQLVFSKMRSSFQF
jgi:hypothetical protein